SQSNAVGIFQPADCGRVFPWIVWKGPYEWTLPVVRTRGGGIHGPNTDGEGVAASGCKCESCGDEPPVGSERGDGHAYAVDPRSHQSRRKAERGCWETRRAEILT